MASDRGAGRGNTASARGVIAETPLGESRWPPVAAVLVFMALNIVVRVCCQAKARSTYRGFSRRSRVRCWSSWSRATRWRPVFLDYLHLGFTNATAFSPADVVPLTHRAKYAMLVQSTVALTLFGLVVARAVNAFT